MAGIRNEPWDTVGLVRVAAGGGCLDLHIISIDRLLFLRAPEGATGCLYYGFLC